MSVRKVPEVYTQTIQKLSFLSYIYDHFLFKQEIDYYLNRFKKHKIINDYNDIYLRPDLVNKKYILYPY